MTDDDSARLLDAAQALMEAARRHGAQAADAAVAVSRSRGASVRLGGVEDVESSESEGLSLRVFVDGRVASVSAPAGGSLDALAERAVAMARVSPRDPYAGLADPSLLAREDIDLDLFDATAIDSARLVADALELEDAARSVAGVSNSGGASTSAGFSGLVLVTSAGFCGARRRSGFSRSVSVLAGEGSRMQRDHDHDSRVHFSDLEATSAIGRRAGERAVARLDPGTVETGRMPVVFERRIAKSLVGHLLGAILGSSIARGTSFLKDRLGNRVLPSGFDIVDDPLVPRGLSSRPFDGEGVRAAPLALVEDGVLANWLLDGASARELGLTTNGRASRSGSGTSPSSTNIRVSPGSLGLDALIAETGRGLYVTELIGQGADIVTGDYSRGASGFLIEDGRIGRPVSGFSIAGHLSDMLLSLAAADDPDPRGSVAAPTLRVGELTVAGR